jgi:hypothetical protein
MAPIVLKFMQSSAKQDGVTCSSRGYILDVLPRFHFGNEVKLLMSPRFKQLGWFYVVHMLVSPRNPVL